MTKVRSVGRPRVEDSAKRSGTPVHFRLTVDERVVLEGKAARAGLTLSDFIRFKVFADNEKLIIHRNDNLPSAELLLELRKLSAEIRELKQLGEAQDWEPRVMYSLQCLGDEAAALLRKIHHDR